MLLLEHFHKLTLDLENIGKLKGLILQLAVRGKLSAEWRKRNGQTESAEELLERVKVEKKKLVKAGKLKVDKALPAIADDEIPFGLPEGWAWARLGEICTKIGSGSTPRGGKDAYKSEGIKFIRSQNVYNEGLVFNNVAYIDEGTHRKMEGTKVLPNDILLNITGGSIGRCALVPQDFDEANVSQHVTIIRTVPLLEAEFIHQLFMSPYFQDNIMATQTGGNREGLAKKNMELMLIPIAPLPEQREIIEIVKQSFEKVYQLQDLAKEREILKEQFVGSALNKLTANTLVGWPIVKENFRSFFNDQRSVSKLKESILQLAVQGKLTPQVETDEPAAELLKRIKAEKQKLVKEGKLKKEKELSPVNGEEIPFELPKGWVWCRLGEAALKITDGFHNTPKRTKEGYPYVLATHIKSAAIDFENCSYVSEKDHKELWAKAFPQKGEILLVNIGAGCGTPAVIDVDFEFSFKNSAIIKQPKFIESKYLFMYLLSIKEKVYSEIIQGGAQPYLSLKMINHLLFPLPPLSEQKRIVIKVDELLKLIDHLEQRVASSQTSSQQLLHAVLKEAFEGKEERYISSESLSIAAEA